MGDHVVFFYANEQKGTLMAPQVLHRVIHGRPDPEPWQKNLLTFQPAILHGYRRYRVRGATYPGIAPATTTTAKTEDANSPSQPESQEDQTKQQQQQQQQTEEEEERSKSSVLGTLVSGLTDGDMYRLDIFEGDEYVRKPVQVRTLRESLDVNQDQQLQGTDEEGGNTDEHLCDVLDAAGVEFADEGDEDVSAVAYVYVAGEGRLEDKEWDFESFKRDSMGWWVRADEREW